MLRAGRHVPAVAVFLITLAAVLVADLAIKSWAFQAVRIVPAAVGAQVAPKQVDPPGPIPLMGGRPLIPYLLGLRLVANTGAVFGLGQGGQWVFVLVSVAATAVIFIVFARSRAGAYVQHVALALILAGALGNLYDRLHFQAVRDMFELFPGVHLPFGWRWPGSGARELYPWIFNLADASLLVGVGLILLLMWRKPAEETGESQKSEARS